MLYVLSIICWRAILSILFYSCCCWCYLFLLFILLTLAGVIDTVGNVLELVVGGEDYICRWLFMIYYYYCYNFTYVRLCVYVMGIMVD